jgi:hypothetical protein
MFRQSILILGTLALVLSPLVASGADELARLVPVDAGMCLEVDGLPRHVEAFLGSPLYRRIEQFPPWQAWHQKNAPGLRQIAGELGRQLGVPPARLWNEVLGGRVLMAVWPPESDPASESPQRQDGPVLFLIRTPHTEALEQALAGMRQAQTKNDGFQWSKSSYRSQEYFVAHSRGAEEAADDRQAKELIFHQPGLAIVSNRSALLHHAIDLLLSSGEPAPRAGPRSLADLPEYQAAVAESPQHAAARLFINPRPWDEHLQREIQTAPEPQRDEKRTALHVWKAVQFGALYLEMGESIALHGLARYESQKLPPLVNEVIESLAGQASMLDRVPADAILTLATRIDIARIAQVALAVRQQQGERPNSGEQLFVQLLRCLGPEMAGYVRARPLRQAAVPLEWVAGIELRVINAAPAMNLQQVLESTFPLALDAMARWQLGDAAPQVRRQVEAGRDVTRIEGWQALPEGESLLLWLDGARFMVSNELRAVVQAADLTPLAGFFGTHRLAELLHPWVSPPGHILAIDFAAARSWLSEHSGELTPAVAQSRGISQGTAARGLKQLHELLEAADLLVLAGKIDDGRAAFSWVVTARSAP